MPPKKKRKGQYTGGEWKVQERSYRKKRSNEKDTVRETKGAGYAELVKENLLFEEYYQGQGFIPSEEWSTFISILRESLPATFRITGTRRMADMVLGCLQKRFFVELASLEVDGEKVPAPFPLPWYPNKLAWNVGLTKKFIRKSPLVSKFHTFLVRHSDQGNISRQEAVSMIPPLLLDVKPHHKVLDMCAAPGSKTAQLIEILHADDSGSSPMPGGVVIANDADNKRCYMLVHQAKRLNSPCFMVTNHDASVFPMLYYHDVEDRRRPLFYDRVLCDVPCSGDGTLRKNLTIWQSWTPLLGPALHKLQLRILNRGLELLCPGGKLVYSTCSLNPVENEAVIATVLGLSKGAMKLVDCRDSLKGLKTLPGRTSWKLMTKEGAWLDSYEAIPEPLLKHFAPSMFPPKCTEDLDLERCIRVLPHHQDTGGFFIAVLVKEDWLPWQTKARASTAAPAVFPTVLPGKGSLAGVVAATEMGMAQDAENEGEGGASGGGRDVAQTDMEEGSASAEQEPNKDGEDSRGAAAAGGEQKDEKVSASVADDGRKRPSTAILGKPDFKRKSGRGFKEDPYVFFGKTTDFFDNIKRYYGLPEDFPVQQLLTRTRTGKKRHVYFCSNTVRELTRRNENSVKIINIGVKVLSRCESSSSCSFRLCQEGVDSLMPYISDHQVLIEMADLLLLLTEANPLITSLTPQTMDRLQTLGIGPVVFTYRPPAAQEEPGRGTEMEHIPDASGSVPLTCPLHLSGWLAAKSARLFLDKSYRYIILSLLGKDPPTDISLESMNAARRRALQAEQGSTQQEEGGDMGGAGSDSEVKGSEEEDVSRHEEMEVDQGLEEKSHEAGVPGDLAQEVCEAEVDMPTNAGMLNEEEPNKTSDHITASGDVGGAMGVTKDDIKDNETNNRTTGLTD